jgi:DNA mismatch repair ATPase MutS
LKDKKLEELWNGEIMEFIIAIIIILICFFIKGIYDRKTARIKLIQKLKKEWGQVPEEEYTLEEFKSITAYYQSCKDEDHDIDDITWNDINMDQVYMLINNTSCAIGEEYLYSLLRKIKFEEKELKERNRLTEFFQKDADKRLQLQVVLKGMGKLRNISVYEYINKLDSLPLQNSLKQYLMAGGLLLSIAVIFFNPPFGGTLTLFMVVNNIIQYYRSKAEVDAYFTVCSYIIRLLDSIKGIAKLDIAEIKTYKDQLLETEKKFARFKKGSSIVAGKNPNGDMADIILDYVRMLFHTDLIKFNSMLDCFKKNRSALNEMFENIGILDSMIAVASFRTMMDYYCIPELKHETKPFLEAEELYHPMIDEPVANSISEQKCVLITGSNASGKSTFIKTLAINAILSQTIYTSMCKSYKASYFQIASSMALQDNIFSKESYYIVEIKSLKRIIDRLNKDIPTLCFVDEVLRGTNTLERIAASSEILYSISQANALCFAATHDIELTHILENYYSNYHFQEQIMDNNILFDYKLFKGRAISKNAIKLLSIIGYSEEIIKNATDRANRFQDEGTWDMIEQKKDNNWYSVNQSKNVNWRL